MSKSFNIFLTELTHFRDVKTPGLVKKLLSSDVCVNIKVDQGAFVIKRVDDQLKFYGKDGKTEIDKIKRTGMDLYKKPIAHIEKCDWKKLPNNVEIFTEFFDPKLKSLMSYSEVPKNNLIISYCKDGSKVIPPNDPMNEKIAGILDIAPPPILFDGKLDKKQRDAILGYIESPSETPFLEFILGLFTTPKQLEYLVKDNFEGLVFYMDNEEVPSAKLVDPKFTAGIAAKKEDNEADAYTEILQKLTFEYMSSAFEASISKVDTFKSQDDYIELVGDMIEYLDKEYGSKFKVLAPYKDQVEEKRFSNVDYDLLPAKAKSIIKSKWYMEDVFRTILFALQKKKMRADPRTGITVGRKDLINSLVAKLDAKKAA
jgi:hypothetical protein